MQTHGSWSINTLDIDDRIKRALNAAGIRLIDDLCEQSEVDLFKVSGIGKLSIDAIKAALAKINRSLPFMPS
jgi:DNA-directed RNA polymerase alpha subunit